MPGHRISQIAALRQTLAEKNTEKPLPAAFTSGIHARSPVATGWGAAVYGESTHAQSDMSLSNGTLTAFIIRIHTVRLHLSAALRIHRTRTEWILNRVLTDLCGPYCVISASSTLDHRPGGPYPAVVLEPTSTVGRVAGSTQS